MGSETFAYMEIFYSDERKQEMMQTHEKNCELLLSLLERELKKKDVQGVKLSVPTNRDRGADIVLEFIITNESEIERVEKLVREIGGYSIGQVTTYILE